MTRNAWLLSLMVSLPAHAQQAWIKSGAIYWQDGARLHLFTGDGRHVRSTEPLEGSISWEGDELVATGRDRVATFDRQLRPVRRCVLPAGWVFWFGAVSDADGKLPERYARYDRRSCRLEPFSDRFNAFVGTGGSWSFSPSGRLVAIDPDGMTMVGERTVTIYAYPTLKPLRTEHNPGESAKFGADTMGSLSDKGELRWTPASTPCHAMFGDAVQLEGDVYASPAGIWQIDRLACPSLEVQREDDRLLAPLRLDGPEAQVLRAQPGLVVLANGARVFRVTFPKGARGFDYARPAVEELVTAADAEPIKRVIAEGGLLLLLAESKAWLARGAKLEPLRVP